MDEEEEEEFLVPQNSFADESSGHARPYSPTTSPTKNSKFSIDGRLPRIDSGKSSGLLSAPSRTGFKSPPGAPSKSNARLSELSLDQKNERNEFASDRKIDYYCNSEVLRSGYSARDDLKSRLYNRPSDSEVFKTMSSRRTTKGLQEVNAP